MKKLLFCLLFSCSVVVNAEYNKEVLIEKMLQTDTNSIGQVIRFPQSKNNEVTILKVTIPPGKSTGWHKHLFPVFAFVQEGTLIVELQNKKPSNYPAGSTFAEVIDVLHNGKNEGKKDVVLIAFFMGEKGKLLSIKQ